MAPPSTARRKVQTPSAEGYGGTLPQAFADRAFNQDRIQMRCLPNNWPLMSHTSARRPRDLNPHREVTRTAAVRRAELAHELSDGVRFVRNRAEREDLTARFGDSRSYRYGVEFAPQHQRNPRPVTVSRSFHSD